MLLFYTSNATPLRFEYADRMADDGPKRHTLEDLLTVMARLRDPVSGCPWDVAADLCHHRSLHYRRGLRGRGRYRPRGPRCPEGRARRSLASGRLSCPDGFGAEPLRVR